MKFLINRIFTCETSAKSEETFNIISDNKRIARNSLLLYLRMLLLLVVSLYTSRIILATLGIEDFGLYNVVGSVVAMFSFISAAMSNASQRFIVYALGEGDLNFQKAVFKTSRLIHYVVATVVVFLAETIGCKRPNLGPSLIWLR